MARVLGAAEPLALGVIAAIRDGDLTTLETLLAEHPDLAGAVIEEVPGGDDTAEAHRRSLLHVATDWPGHFPNGAQVVQLLIDAGADVNARFAGPHTETPLHWAASCDDVAVLDVLLDNGADIDAEGAVIAGRGPLADATAFAQWRAARRLVERGATANSFEAACLGMLDVVRSQFAEAERASGGVPREWILAGFWGACHGGQIETAAYLLERGAELDWVAPWDATTPIEAAERNGFDEMVAWLRDRGAASPRPPRGRPGASD
jgi:ankyrin repeat protein